MSAAVPEVVMCRRWSPVIVLACIWIGMMLAAVLFAHLSPHDYQTMDLRARLAPPALFGGTWNHPLGSDELGCI